MRFIVVSYDTDGEEMFMPGVGGYSFNVGHCKSQKTFKMTKIYRRMMERYSKNEWNHDDINFKVFEIGEYLKKDGVPFFVLH
tara:strand:- start:6789 stop:7034 length:246 start_codon:yes stop_codon:yes gene_type:complete